MNHRAFSEVSEWVSRFAPLVRSGGAVLDVACGQGRNARLFMVRGHPVVAVDRELSGVADLAEQPGFEAIAADLESGAPWPLGDRRFAGVVVTNYLHRPLFPALLASLEPAGVLIYETFARGNERFGRPRRPDHLLEEGELREVVRGKLNVVAYEHIEINEPKPAMVQRICAVKDR